MTEVWFANMALAITEIIAYSRPSPPISSRRIASWTCLHRLPSASPVIGIACHRRPSSSLVIVIACHRHRRSSAIIAGHRHRQSSPVITGRRPSSPVIDIASHRWLPSSSPVIVSPAIVIADHRLSIRLHRHPSSSASIVIGFHRHASSSAAIVIGIHRHWLPSPCQSKR